MGHTPGPWEVVEPGEVDEHYAVLDGFGHTASVYGYPEEAAVALANARLIAAAPEMLAALKRVIAEANCAMDYIGVDAEHTLKRALERISKAKCVCEQTITKAEGRTDAD